MTIEELTKEIQEWANEHFVGQPMRFERIVAEMNAMASSMFGQSVHLLRPRMEGTALIADGFVLEKPVEIVRINYRIGESE